MCWTSGFFMIRKSEFLSSLPSEYRDDFIDPNPIAVHKLTILKKMLKARLVSQLSLSIPLHPSHKTPTPSLSINWPSSRRCWKPDWWVNCLSQSHKTPTPLHPSHKTPTPSLSINWPSSRRCWKPDWWANHLSQTPFPQPSTKLVFEIIENIYFVFSSFINISSG